MVPGRDLIFDEEPPKKAPPKLENPAARWRAAPAGTKPHHGRVITISEPAVGETVVGEFLDHPSFRGVSRTSKIVRVEGDEFETKNSRYTRVRAGRPSRFRDFPHTGDYAYFLNRNGHDSEREAAAKVLAEGTRYTVADCAVGGWRSTVSLEAVAGRFNTVMFRFERKPE